VKLAQPFITMKYLNELKIACIAKKILCHSLFRTAKVI